MSVSSSVDLIMFGKTRNVENERNRDLRGKLGTLEGALKLRDKMIRQHEAVEPMLGVKEGTLKRSAGEMDQDDMEVEEQDESTEASASEDDAFVEVESSDDGTDVSRSY